MELNDKPTRQDKKQFIDGFLVQHRELLFGLLDDVPENWNSWHLRKLIKDTIKTYSLSSFEEDQYRKKLSELTPNSNQIIFTEDQVIQLMDKLGKFYKSDLTDYPNVKWHTCGGMASDQIKEESKDIIKRLL